MSLHGIKIAVHQTGLSAHVLRVWEKRYGAVTPQRTETNRRLYTDDDIKRLQYLVSLTQTGYSIGQIANLEDDQLAEMAASTCQSTQPSSGHESQTSRYVQQCIDAIRAMDQENLERVFDVAILDLGYSGLLGQVMIPVIQQIGIEWNEGTLTTADEHAATNFIKEYLTQRVKSYIPEPHAPTLLATTPSGQMHELGAFLGSCLARKIGWKVIYLGASLPADAIAGAAIRANAAAVLLSIVYPIDDTELPSELIRLRKQLPDELPILIGGNAAMAYEPTIQKINATVVSTIPDLVPQLNQIRQTRAIKANN